jgi:hypothetical protein
MTPKAFSLCLLKNSDNKQGKHMTKKKTPAAVATANNAPSTEQRAPSLELNDLAVTLQLIELAIQRGAYQPRELTAVGETYARMEAFLTQQSNLQAAAANTQGEE